MAFKIVLLCAWLAVANAGYLGGYSSLGYAHSYATPLAYSAGHYGGGHLSSYSSPIVSKTIATAPLAYSSPLAHYSAGLHHYHAPAAVYATHQHHVAAPIVTKSYAPALHYAAAPSLYSAHVSTPFIAKSYGGYGSSLGYSSYPSLGYGYGGYASKYHF